MSVLIHYGMKVKSIEEKSMGPDGVNFDQVIRGVLAKTQVQKPENQIPEIILEDGSEGNVDDFFNFPPASIIEITRGTNLESALNLLARFGGYVPQANFFFFFLLPSEVNKFCGGGTFSLDDPNLFKITLVARQGSTAEKNIRELSERVFDLEVLKNK